MPALQDPDLGMQPVKHCRKAAAPYLLGVQSVAASNLLVTPNVCWYFGLFGKCKKGEDCKKSHSCSLCGDSHALYKCPKADSGVGYRLNEMNKRWNDKSYFNKGKGRRYRGRGRHYNNNGGYNYNNNYNANNNNNSNNNSNNNNSG